MVSLRLSIALLAAALSVPVSIAQTFDTHTTPTGTIGGFELSDVNRDGLPDFIAWINYAYQTQQGFAVMLNQGGGNFSAPMFVSSTRVYSLRVGDFNNDGNPDVVRCNSQGPAIWLGDGAGHFSKAGTTSGGCNIAVGDFNRDGHLDVASIDFAYDSFGRSISNTIVVHLGDGKGGYSGTRTTTGLGIGVTLEQGSGFGGNIPADMNRDGYPDLVVTDDGGFHGRAAILLNDGTAHFTYKKIFDAELAVDGVEVNDINQDGWLDLLMNSQDDERSLRTLTLMLHQSDGSYSQKEIYSNRLESGYSFSFSHVAFADLDGDGVKDLVFGEHVFPEGSDVPFHWLHLLYFSDNTFQNVKRDVAIEGDGLGVITAADFDRDGRPDIAGLNGSGLNILLDRTASAPVCSAVTAPLRTVTLCSPAEGSNTGSPTRVLANITSGTPISAVKIYLDGVSKFTGYEPLVNTFLNISPGPHKVTVKAWDRSGAFSESNSFTVGASGCAASSTNRTVKICTPANGSSVSSPVRLQAAITDSASVTVKVYVDGVAMLTTTVKSIDWSTPLSAGSHTITVRAWDSTGNFSSTTAFTVQ